MRYAYCREAFLLLTSVVSRMHQHFKQRESRLLYDCMMSDAMTWVGGWYHQHHGCRTAIVVTVKQCERCNFLFATTTQLQSREQITITLYCICLVTHTKTFKIINYNNTDEGYDDDEQGGTYHWCVSDPRRCMQKGVVSNLL